MPAAIIEINGVAGSNTDLPINTSVTLTNQDAGGEVTYAWSIVDQPDGAADALSGSSGPSVTFTPKKEGTYLIRLVVNSSLTNQVVAAVRHLKTRIRIPAGSETNEAASAPRGWATSANITLGLIDSTKADPGTVVGQAAASLARGDVVRMSGVATLKSGLPGQEVVPSWTKAAASSTSNARGLLGIVEGAVDGGSITSGVLINVRLRGLFQGATVGGSPSVGAQVFLSDTSGTAGTAVGTVRRLIGRIVAGSGPWDIAFDGAGLSDDGAAPTYSAGTGLTLTTNTFAADFGTTAGKVLEGSNDALYVKLAGAQTVTGVKTFSTQLVIGATGELQGTDGTGPVTIYTFASSQHELGAQTGTWRFTGGTSLTIRASSSLNNTRVLIDSTGFEFFVGNSRRALLTSGLHIGLTSVSRSAGEVSAQTRFIVGTAAADASASFEMQGTTTGWLGPRLTTTQRNAIASPATSLVIYNTTNARFEWYSGSAWLPWGSWLGGEPFYFAGPAGSGPGGSNPQYATLTAMMNAMVADGATALAPRVGFFTGTLTENPTLRAGTFIVGLGASRRASTILGRVDYQPASSPNTPIAGLAHCRVIQTGAAVDAIYVKPAADAELWLDDVEADCEATSATYASLNVDGSLGGAVTVRATRCSLYTPGGSSAKGLRVTSAAVYYDGHIVMGAGASAQADAIYASSATVVFNPTLDGQEADKHIGGRVYLTGTGSVVTIGHGTRHETAALSGSNPLITIDGAQTVNLGAVRVKAGANTTKHIEKTGAGTATVNVLGPTSYADATSAALQIDSGITYNGECLTTPERVQLITTTATIAKDTTLAIVTPASGSTFTVTMSNPAGFQPDRRLRVKYTGPTNKQDLTLAAHTSGGTDYDAAKDSITLKWNDAYDFAPSSSKWLILGQYNANPGGGGGGSTVTRVAVLAGAPITNIQWAGATYVGTAYWKAADHDLTGGRKVRLRVVGLMDGGFGSSEARVTLFGSALGQVISVQGGNDWVRLIQISAEYGESDDLNSGSHNVNWATDQVFTVYASTTTYAGGFTSDTAQALFVELVVEP